METPRIGGVSETQLLPCYQDYLSTFIQGDLQDGTAG